MIDRIPKRVLASLSQASTVDCDTWLHGFFLRLGLGSAGEVPLDYPPEHKALPSTAFLLSSRGVVKNVHPSPSFPRDREDGMWLKIHGLA
jgi:hypothetical protein